jgi:hypothetical protein
MSPHIEGEGRTEVYSLEVNYFKVDLAPASELDLEEFGRLAKKIGAEGGVTSNYSFLKFIVASDVMYIFREVFPHDEVAKALGLQKEALQCAGRLTVNSEEEIRRLDRYSKTLYKAHLLSPEDSEDYKKTLSASLGAHFQVI